MTWKGFPAPAVGAEEQIEEDGATLSANNDETPELPTITVGRWKVYLDDGREDEARDGIPGRCEAGRGA